MRRDSEREGAREWTRAGRSRRRRGDAHARGAGVGNDTLVSALHAGEDRARDVATSARISGLIVPLDLDATTALHAVRASGGDGHIDIVSDEQAWEVQAWLARHEGLYVELAGAVSMAGLCRAAARGQVGAHERVVCLLTGHGFKDAAAARRMATQAGGGGTFEEHQLDDALIERLAGVPYSLVSGGDCLSVALVVDPCPAGQ
jgi:threonine synthase